MGTTCDAARSMLDRAVALTHPWHPAVRFRGTVARCGGPGDARRGRHATAGWHIMRRWRGNGFAGWRVDEAFRRRRDAHEGWLMNTHKWTVALAVTVLVASVTLTRYQPGSARVMICQDDQGFVVFHLGGVRETYGTGFTLETIEWFLGLGAARSRQVVVDDPEATCTRDARPRSSGPSEGNEPPAAGRGGLPRNGGPSS